MNKSEQMARVRVRGTEPELRLRRSLAKRGVRYRLHRKDLPGKPDVYVARLRLAIFVNGCFWHGHDCARGKRPATNADFWNAKIERTRVRDAQVVRALGKCGIETLTLWACANDCCDDVAERISQRFHNAFGVS